MPDSKFSSLVCYTKLPDWNEMGFLLRILRAGDGFIDIGANVGFYTLLASTRCSPGCIWAAEALPRNVEVLRAQLALNKLEAINILPFALSSENGAAQFISENRETGTIASGESGPTITVPTRKLDDLLESDALPRQSIAKMDVEGCEVEVLQGASRLLASAAVGVWLFELSEQNLAQRGRTRHDLLNLFEQHRYIFWEWTEDSLSLAKINPLQSSSANFLAIHCTAAWVTERLQVCRAEHSSADSVYRK